MKQAKEVLGPKQAAIEAEVFTQQVHQAIANRDWHIRPQALRIDFGRFSEINESVKRAPNE